MGFNGSGNKQSEIIMTKYTALYLIVLSAVFCGCKPKAESAPPDRAESAAQEIAAEKTIPEIIPLAVVTKVEDAPKAQKPQPKVKKNKAEEKSEEKKDPSAFTELDFYKNCDYIFKTYVNEQGEVDYMRLRRKRLELYEATSKLKDLPTAMLLSWSENEKKAFWLNAHNILMLKLVIDNYPIKPHWLASINYPRNSIKQIPGAREKVLFRVMGFQYTLAEIEEVVLDRFKDVQVCFAISYASASGGKLRNEAYHPDKLDKQLDEQTKKYLADVNNFKIDKSSKVIYLSSLLKFKNFKSAFVNSKYSQIKKFREKDQEVRAYLNFILLNIPPKDVETLESIRYDIKFNIYNWQLNEQPLK